MKRLWLLVLAAPLAGCAQRAELASSVGQPAQGPFTLRYKLTDQPGTRYQLRIDGETTTGISSQTGADGTTDAPERAVQAKFQTRMTIRQDSSAALDPIASTPTEPTTTPPGTDDTDGTTSMNEDRASGDERLGDTTMSDMASESAPPSTGPASRFELRQEVQSWTAQVDLPKGHVPNRLNGTFQDGQMAVEAQGARIDLPRRYQQQIQQTLSRPVLATVTPVGEILNVEWPVPEQAAADAPGGTTDRSADGLRAMTGSTETLNLWFGVIRLPEQAVTVGQTWDAKDRFPVRAGADGPQFHMEREAKYTLTDVTQTADGPVAEIAVNETLKLVRGDLTDSESTATLGTGSAVMNDSTKPTLGAALKPDLLQTRMGKVYFNINRGAIDRSEQQVSVTWDTTLSEAATATGAISTGIATQGQLQGTVHLERINDPAAIDATGSRPTPPSVPETTTPPSAPTDNTPEPPGGAGPNDFHRVPAP